MPRRRVVELYMRTTRSYTLRMDGWIPISRRPSRNKKKILCTYWTKTRAGWPRRFCALGFDGCRQVSGRKSRYIHTRERRSIMILGSIG